MLVIYMLVLVAAICMLGELLLFHLVLIARGISTYEFIVAQREELGAPGAQQQQPSAVADVCGLFARVLTCQVSNVGVSTSRSCWRVRGRGCAASQGLEVLPGPPTQGCAGRGARVHDEAAAASTAAAAARRGQVSLNPCAACKSHKLEGGLRDWDPQARGRAAAPAGSGTGVATTEAKEKAGGPFLGLGASGESYAAAAGGLIPAGQQPQSSYHAAAVVKATPGGDGSSGPGPVPEHYVGASSPHQLVPQSASVLALQAAQAYGRPAAYASGAAVPLPVAAGPPHRAASPYMAVGGAAQAVPLQPAPQLAQAHAARGGTPPHGSPAQHWVGPGAAAGQAASVPGSPAASSPGPSAAAPPMQTPWRPPPEVLSGSPGVQSMLATHAAHNSAALARHLGSSPTAAGGHQPAEEPAGVSGASPTARRAESPLGPLPALQRAPQAGAGSPSPSLRLPPMQLTRSLHQAVPAGQAWSSGQGSSGTMSPWRAYDAT